MSNVRSTDIHLPLQPLLYHEAQLLAAGLLAFVLTTTALAPTCYCDEVSRDRTSLHDSPLRGRYPNTLFVHLSPWGARPFQVALELRAG